MVQLVELYMTGQDSLEPDTTKGIGLYLKAARLDDVDAMRVLGEIYLSGDGVPAD